MALHQCDQCGSADVAVIVDGIERPVILRCYACKHDLDMSAIIHQWREDHDYKAAGAPGGLHPDCKECECTEQLQATVTDLLARLRNLCPWPRVQVGCWSDGTRDNYKVEGDASMLSEAQAQRVKAAYDYVVDQAVRGEFWALEVLQGDGDGR